MITEHQCCLAHPLLDKLTTATQWQLEFCLVNACELLCPYIDLIKSTDRILDIGCGSGFISSLLGNKVSKGKLIGIDIEKNRD